MALQAPKRQLTNVYLGGALGKQFGKEWRLAVGSPAEAMRAIDVNTKGKFLRYLGMQGKSKYYKIALKRKDQTLGAAELTHRSGATDIYIWPTLKGRNSGTAKIIAGVIILAVVTYFTVGTGTAAADAALTGADEGLVGGAGTLATTSGSTLAFGGAIGGVLTSVGVSLILGGISQLLSPSKNGGGGELNSNTFQGSISAGAQGGSVPVVYGKALVSPTPISIWFNNIDYQPTQNAYVGAVQITLLNGGGYEVTPFVPAPVMDDSGGD